MPSEPGVPAGPTRQRAPFGALGGHMSTVHVGLKVNRQSVAGFYLSRAPARHQLGCGLRRTHAEVGHKLPKEAGSAHGGGRHPLAE